MATLAVEIKNNTTNNTVWAYVTGYDIDNGNKLLLIAADGKTKYYPPSPPAGQTCQPLPQDCAIKLAPAGQSTMLSLCHIGGCRIWFSTNDKLKFALNPGPAIVEPSCTNPADPNINLNWAFCELTYNADQVFCNISMVDFVSNIPCALTLVTNTGHTDHVSGMSINGLANVCRSLKWQAAQDKQPWDKLIVNGPDGKPLRVLSPNNAIIDNVNLFKGYFEPYINAVYAKHTGNTQISCDTQAQWGVVKGAVNNDTLCFDGQNVKFPKPSTQDILSCCTGPFADGSPEQLCITPRLSAAFNRATLPIATGGTPSQSSTIPDAAGPSSYYQYQTCNHYARIVHEQLLDGRGYGFPYDDVCQNATSVELFTIAARSYSLLRSEAMEHTARLELLVCPHSSLPFSSLWKFGGDATVEEDRLNLGYQPEHQSGPRNEPTVRKQEPPREKQTVPSRVKAKLFTNLNSLIERFSILWFRMFTPRMYQLGRECHYVRTYPEPDPPMEYFPSHTGHNDSQHNVPMESWTGRGRSELEYEVPTRETNARLGFVPSHMHYEIIANHEESHIEGMEKGEIRFV